MHSKIKNMGFVDNPCITYMLETFFLAYVSWFLFMMFAEVTFTTRSTVIVLKAIIECKKKTVQCSLKAYVFKILFIYHLAGESIKKPIYNPCRS